MCLTSTEYYKILAEWNLVYQSCQNKKAKSIELRSLPNMEQFNDQHLWNASNPLKADAVIEEHDFYNKHVQLSHSISNISVSESYNADDIWNAQNYTNKPS